jgi:hypothetical protein
MATPPTERLPTWATGGGADIVDPGVPQQALGWVVDDKPPAGWLNWWKRTVGQWITYLDTLGTEHEARLDAVDALDDDRKNAALLSFGPSPVRAVDSFETAGLVDMKWSEDLFGSGSEGWIGCGRDNDTEPAVVRSRALGSAIAPVKVTAPADNDNLKCIAIPQANTALVFQVDGNVYKMNVTAGTWTTMTNLPTTADPVSAAANLAGNVTIVVQDSGLIRRSADAGTTWTNPTVPVITLGASGQVRWDENASLFFLGGDDGFCTSPDGITWTDRTGIVPSGTSYAYDDLIWDPETALYYIIARTAGGLLRVFSNPTLTSGTATLVRSGSISCVTFRAATNGAGAIVIHGGKAQYSTVDGVTWPGILSDYASSQPIIYIGNGSRFAISGIGYYYDDVLTFRGFMDVTPAIW